jgi:hypothetical protein
VASDQLRVAITAAILTAAHARGLRVGHLSTNPAAASTDALPVTCYLYQTGTYYTMAEESQARAVLAELGAGDVTATRDTIGGIYTANIDIDGLPVSVKVNAADPAAPEIDPARVTAAYLVLDDHNCPDCLDNSPCGTHAESIRKAIAAADKAGAR